MHRAALPAPPRSRPDRPGREEPHRAKGVEALEDPARGSVVQGLRGYGLAQKKLRVWLGQALFQAGQRTAAPERLPPPSQYDRPCLPPPLRRHLVLDQADEA